MNNIVLEASRPDKRRRLSKLEWLSLLDVNVEGRTVSKQQRTYLRQSLESEEGQSGARSLQVRAASAPVVLCLQWQLRCADKHAHSCGTVLWLVAARG